MGNTIYASFATPGDAEKAAGALLDHGVKAEDLSIVSSHSGEGVESSSYASSTSQRDGDNDMKNAGDAAYGMGSAAVDKMQEGGARMMGAASDALGQEQSQAKWEGVAKRENDESERSMGNASNEWNDATDRNRVDAAAGTTGSEGVIGSPTYSAAAETSENRTSNDGGDSTENAAKHGISTTTAADAGAGAVKGAGWGLGIGAIAALASLIVPGVGIVVGGGALAAALGGAAAATAAGAAAGAVTGYLKDQGVEGHVAEQYENTVRSGGAILAVSVPSGDCSREEAMEVLQKYGAANVNAYDARSTGGGYVA